MKRLFVALIIAAILSACGSLNKNINEDADQGIHAQDDEQAQIKERAEADFFTELMLNIIFEGVILILTK